MLVEKALLDEAHENLQRARQLSKSNSISAVELQRQIAAEQVAQARYQLALNTVDESIAQIRVRRAELDLARQNLHDGVVAAPFDGVVQQRHVAVGAYVQVGDPVVTLVRTNPLRFRSGVPERKAMDLQLDQEVRIFVEGEPQPLISRITRISPALDMSSRSLDIEADVPNPDGRWRAGLFAEAEIVVDPNDQALAVPVGAVVEFAGVQKVWIVQDRCGPRATRPNRTPKLRAGRDIVWFRQRVMSSLRITSKAGPAKLNRSIDEDGRTMMMDEHYAVVG